MMAIAPAHHHCLLGIVEHKMTCVHHSTNILHCILQIAQTHETLTNSDDNFKFTHIDTL